MAATHALANGGWDNRVVFQVGLLWYLRRGVLSWFAVTILLGIGYFVGFFCYVTRAR